jgi:hypothetical protein
MRAGSAIRRISPDLKWILVGEQGGRRLKLTEAKTGKERLNVGAANYNLKDCRFSDGGNFIISHSEKGLAF